MFLRYSYYNITFNIPTCFGPKGIIGLESNKSNTE
jgi:hypothetical protein